MATKLITHADDQTERIQYIRDGRAGNFEVVYKMIDLIVNAVEYDKGLENLIKQHLIAGFSDLSELNIKHTFTRLYDFVKSHVKFIPDIAGKVESLKSPRRTLSDGYGDCDDHAILNAAILAVLGFEPKIVLMRYDNARPNFDHIYTVCYVNGERFVFDTGIPNGQLNSEMPAVERQEINVFNNESIANNISALVYRVKHGLKGAGRDTLEALPELLSMLPSGLGYVASNVVSQSVAMMLGGTAQKTPNEIGSEVNQALDSIIYQLHTQQIALDHAKMLTRKAIGELETIPARDEVFQAIADGVAPKVQFILNFEDYAKEHAISVIYLDGRAMILTGALVLGVGGYYYFKKRKRGIK